MNKEDRVLVVDDDRHIAASLRNALETDGFKADVVRNSETALALLSRREYGCVVTDYAMEGMRGDRLCSIIRAMYPEVRVLLITGFRHEIPEDRLQRFDAVMEKPVDPRRLIGALRSFRRVVQLHDI